MRVLIWFYRDLRTHDHAGLNWALANGHEVTAVVFEPFSKCSEAKLKFWRETAENLSLNLKTAGVNLEISREQEVLKIPSIVKTKNIETILTHRRMNSRDHHVLELVAQNSGVPLLEIGDLTLYDSSQVSELSLSQLRPFTNFKNLITANWVVPPPLDRPSQISLVNDANTEWSAGGEASGLKRMREYIWDTKACLHYHETRNGMMLRDDSSKFSRWLALGAISPRLIYQELLRLEDQEGPNGGITGLIYELIWRDYFKFLSFIMKESFFSLQGLKQSPLKLVDDIQLFEAWRRGETGEDFIDANMRELKETGWMSNRGRQNVASYLSKFLQQDWTLGARWFEEQLIDEDPEMNWGNWLYFAGAGTDPRDRRFDVQRQSSTYDPEGKYQQHWLKTCKDHEAKILELLSMRSPDSTICPSEVLTHENKKDPLQMEEVRSAARRMVNKGLIDICQKGVRKNPYEIKGPIRLRIRDQKD